MNKSRRSLIINMLREGKNDAEILDDLEKEFPSGVLMSSNRSALTGTKWDIGNSTNKSNSSKFRVANKSRKKFSSFERSELIQQLNSFHPSSIIESYKNHSLSGKGPKEILVFSFDRTIKRAFHYETPSKRYSGWRWYNNSELLFNKLVAIGDQRMFDQFAFEIGESLVTDWGAKNDRGRISVMNIGVAMKIVNLLFKHFAFSDSNNNPQIIDWLHVPWDSFTLIPLHKIWRGLPPIPKFTGQGFVKNLDIYLQLHNLITEIALEAGVSRITCEFWAWDLAHTTIE